MTKKYKILLVDDEPGWCARPIAKLKEIGFEVIYEEKAENTLKLIKSESPDVVLLDILFGNENKGKPTFDEIKKKCPDLPVIILTNTMDKMSYQREDYPEVALDYPKAALNSEDDNTYKIFGAKIIEVIRGAYSIDNYLTEFSKLGFIVGSSVAFRDICQIILKASETISNVLITGEKGTGKELVAAAIHHFSKRNGKFIAVNCSGITDTLFETEFFGVCGGTATQVNEREGFFEQAHLGTLFLDEIGAMPFNQQPKLLRALEARKIARVGSNKNCKCKNKQHSDHTEIQFNVKVIAATNEDIFSAVQAGKFRDDLFDRLKVITINVPPLKHRKEDIETLAKSFINKLKNELGKPEMIDTIRPDVKQMLEDYNWPGNIRELKNAIERAMNVTNSAILQKGDFLLGGNQHENEIRYDNDKIAKLVERCMNEENFGYNDIKKIVPIKTERMTAILEGICRRCYEEKRDLTQDLLVEILKLKTRANVQRVLDDHGISTTELKKEYKRK